jgi:hypothetical protein
MVSMLSVFIRNLERNVRPGVFVVCVLASACATRPPATAPGTGTVTVGVVTTGPGVQALSFRVVVDSGPIGSIKADAGVLTRSVPIGEHVIALRELPARCKVEGAEEQRIKVAEDRVTPVRFSVACK